MVNINIEKNSFGFSLVEITLALMVISVGLLAVFGLLGDSLRANTETLDDTIAATFAESVFDSVFASKWTDTEYEVLMGADGFWDDEDTTDSIELCDNETDIKVNKYQYDGIQYYPLKYNLMITKQKPAVGPESNSPAPSNNYVWRALRLRVWIGEFADTAVSNEDVYEFYTEQYKFVDPKEEYEQNN